MGDTITGAASGEYALGIAEGFKISGKRTEENKGLFVVFLFFLGLEFFQSFFITFIILGDEKDKYERKKE